ncbi:MAG TPA: hypothetical protein VI457_02805 [Methylococcaceae bacterium]|nr:hypothetical protein [Methylococcaceae bacterium]
MPTLVLRGVPGELYERLKLAAQNHRRSLTQETILRLEQSIAPRETAKPSVEQLANWLQNEVWTLPVLDQRPADEILGYNEHGCFD